jgi:tRNA-dihydrouridine synthase B
MISSGKNSSTPHRPAVYDWVDDAPFYQAGLAGYSDEAMRMVARAHGCPFCVTEAMLDHFLINGGKGLKAAELSEDDHPIAGQLMGSHPDEIAAGAKILVGLGYDVIDINLACPVKKIKKKCRGGHLLSSPGEAIDILKAVADAVGSDVPMQVKMRRAYDESAESEAAFTQILEAMIQLGYAAVTVHGRTVEQKYLGPSRWPFLDDLTTRYRSETDNGFLIFGSGDVFSAESIFEMIQKTGVGGASVARGCIGNPWIFEQARQLRAGQTPSPPTLLEQRNVLLEHFERSVACHGEKLAGRMMRKFGIKFARHHPDPDAVKNRFIEVKTLADWHGVLGELYSENTA